MKSIKRVSILLTLCVTLLNCVTGLKASSITNNNSQIQYGFKVSAPLYTATGSSMSTSDVRLYQESRNGRVYLCISVNDSNVSVYINNSSYSIYRDDLYHFSCQINESGWYRVTVTNYSGSSVTKEIYVTASNYYNTSLSLSKDYRSSGEVYLVINARDDDGIRSVTVNGSSISFNEYSGETTYRVYNSGTYTVKVTDRNGNEKTESLYIDVNRDRVSLSLSKQSRSNKWYLVIKADSDTSISNVSVNGSSISFPSAGGTQEYEVTKSGTYRVVVRDRNGYTRSDSLTFDLGENSHIKPTVNVQQNYKLNNKPGWYLLISATDDGSISSVTVNGENVPFDATKGRAEYYVPVDATYTIVVTDNDGNAVTYQTFAAGNAGITTSENNSNAAQQSTKIVFKLNSKSWTKDGIEQKTMNVAPKLVNSRLYLPIRYIAYALGVEPEQIYWNSQDKSVTINSSYNTLQVKIGSKNMYVNNQVIQMDTAPIQSGGRVMLPLSQIKMAFSNQNIQLDWDNATKQLTVIR